jgi:hypothetical protein
MRGGGAPQGARGGASRSAAKPIAYRLAARPAGRHPAGLPFRGDFGPWTVLPGAAWDGISPPSSAPRAAGTQRQPLVVAADGAPEPPGPCLRGTNAGRRIDLTKRIPSRPALMRIAPHRSVPLHKRPREAPLTDRMTRNIITDGKLSKRRCAQIRSRREIPSPRIGTYAAPATWCPRLKRMEEIQ